MNSLIDRIAADLHLESTYIEALIMRSDYYYKRYTIPKNNGGRRYIYQASPELKSLQYWIRKNILSELPVSKSAFAYNSGDSIKRHVTYHKDANFIFHTDIKDFFPNIHSKKLKDMVERQQEELQQLGLWYDDLCDILSYICFRMDCLCIGTVSSPAISNIVMYDFDEKLCFYCDNQGYRYSRYADDIYISSKKYIPIEIRKTVAEQLAKNGFIINTDKTCFKSKKGRRQITGLILTESGRVSVGDEMRHSIKKMIYKRLVKGEGNPEMILGYMAYLKDVEPAVYNRYLIKYSTYCNGDVISAIKADPVHTKTIKLELPDI